MGAKTVLAITMNAARGHAALGARASMGGGLLAALRRPTDSVATLGIWQSQSRLHIRREAALRSTDVNLGTNS